MTTIYRETILTEGTNPKNWGVLSEADFSAQAENHSCGDSITAYAKLKGEKIITLSFAGEGCLVMKASASLLSAAFDGKTPRELREITTEQVLRLIGVTLTPARVRCALLPLEAARNLARIAERKI